VWDDGSFLDALVVEALSARYPGQPGAAPALADISLRLAEGERALLLGPNGAGKSTLLRVCAGLMRGTAGHVRILGQAPRGARRLVGVVGHATYLYDELTAAENLRFYGDLYAVPQAAERASALLQRLGLGRLADERVGRLSRGQQQRVALARALLHDPPVLLLDEPDTGLDQAAFRGLEELTLSGGRTALVATHNIRAGLRLCSRAIVLAEGRIAHDQEHVGEGDADRLVALVRDLAEPETAT